MQRAWQKRLLRGVLLLSPSCAVLCARAQNNTLPSPSVSTGIRTGDVDVSRASDPSVFSHDLNLAHRQLVSRREEQHRRMLDNAAKLLTLTRELQESIHLHEPTAGDSRSLDEIAKLARAVRDQMRQ